MERGREGKSDMERWEENENKGKQKRGRRLVTEMLVSQTPMGMSGEEKDTSLSQYIQWSHVKLQGCICQSYILCSEDPKQSHIRLGTLRGFLFLI